jgi:hypothetical protein
MRMFSALNMDVKSTGPVSEGEVDSGQLAAGSGQQENVIRSLSH